MNNKSAKLREAMKQGTVMCPGAWNGLVASAIAQAGFSACYISGGATANSSGYPDVGLITLSEMCRTIREVSDASKLPVVVDADTGYGEVECIARTVVEYERNGASAMHIEDQQFPKRCGHLDGKTLVSQSAMCEKIKTASENRLSPEFILIARTDARGVDGIESAIERGIAYREAGADMIFPEGLRNENEFAEFSKKCPGLLLANMTEFGKTPHITTSRFEELGYDLVIYPVTFQRVAMRAVTGCLQQLFQNGSAEGFEQQMQTRQELYDLLHYVPGEEWRFSNK
tara:strand:+ start:120 stop:977 length:858 start_codon:yes stop_codon:yes gene_type:complete